MSKKIKRTLAVILTAVLVLSCLPVFTLAGAATEVTIYHDGTSSTAQANVSFDDIYGDVSWTLGGKAIVISESSNISYEGIYANGDITIFVMGDVEITRSNTVPARGAAVATAIYANGNIEIQPHTGTASLTVNVENRDKNGAAAIYAAGYVVVGTGLTLNVNTTGITNGSVYCIRTGSGQAVKVNGNINAKSVYAWKGATYGPSTPDGTTAPVCGNLQLSDNAKVNLFFDNNKGGIKANSSTCVTGTVEFTSSFTGKAKFENKGGITGTDPVLSERPTFANEIQSSVLRYGVISSGYFYVAKPQMGGVFSTDSIMKVVEQVRPIVGGTLAGNVDNEDCYYSVYWGNGHGGTFAAGSTVNAGTKYYLTLRLYPKADTNLSINFISDMASPSISATLSKYMWMFDSYPTLNAGHPNPSQWAQAPNGTDVKAVFKAADPAKVPEITAVTTDLYFEDGDSLDFNVILTNVEKTDWIFNGTTVSTNTWKESYTYGTMSSALDGSTMKVVGHSSGFSDVEHVFTIHYVAPEELAITKQPESVSLDEEEISFNVEVSGGKAPLVYTWYLYYGGKESVCATIGPTKFDGIHSPTLKVTASPAFLNSQGYPLFCRITDANGKSVDTELCRVLCKAADHIFDDGVVTKVPSSTEEGERTYSCTKCGFQRTETIEKLPEPGELVIGTQPVDLPLDADDLSFTVEVEGGKEPVSYQWYVLFNSDNTSQKIVNSVGSADMSGSTTKKLTITGHPEYLITIKVSFFCVITDADGSEVTTDVVSVRCATDAHPMFSYTDVPADCVNGGYTEYVCDTCGYKYRDSETASLGHIEMIVDAEVPATCVLDGKTAKIECQECGTLLQTSTVIPATGVHSYDAGVVTKEATTEEEGIMTYTCGDCGDVKTEAIEKLPSTDPETPGTDPETPGTDPETPGTDPETPATGTDGEPAEYVPGDVNGDGNVSSADARLALRRAVGLESFAEGSREFLACDVDFNGKVTSADARLILRGAVGLEDKEAWKAKVA